MRVVLRVLDKYGYALTSGLRLGQVPADPAGDRAPPSWVIRLSALESGRPAR